MYTNDMPTINISLPAKLKADAEALIAAGEYVSFSDVVRHALRSLLNNETGELASLAREAKAEYKAGTATVIEMDEELEVYLASLPKPIGVQHDD